MSTRSVLVLALVLVLAIALLVLVALRRWAWARRAGAAGLRLGSLVVLGFTATGLCLLVTFGFGVFEVPTGASVGHVAFLAAFLFFGGLALWNWGRSGHQGSAIPTTPESTGSRPRVVALLVLLGTILIIEILLRGVLGNYGISALQRDDDNCSLRPGSEVDYTGWLLKIPPVKHSVNELGYRGPPRPREKPESSFRIVMVGDSQTFGQGVADGATIAARLERGLNDAHSRHFEVLNFGIEGLNVEDIFRRYSGYASQWDHDLFLYLMNANDLDGSACDAVTWGSDLLRNSYVLRLTFMMTFVALAFVEAVDTDDPEQPAEDQRMIKGLERLSLEARARGAAFGVAMLADPMIEGKRSQGTWRERAPPLLDLSHIWLDRSLVIPGEYHLNEQGSQQVADAIVEWLPGVVQWRDGARR